VQVVAIVLMSIGLAMAYGILHDQVTARICVEYFTIGHPSIFGIHDPTILGLGWGVLATWWVGIMLGFPLAAAARLGKRPKRSATSLVRPLVMLMCVSAACALAAGTLGAILARNRIIWLVEPMASAVPRDKHVAFLADLWAHNASYLSGFIGGGVIILSVWLQRRNAALT
jgi:hypothetical protein